MAAEITTTIVKWEDIVAQVPGPRVKLNDVRIGLDLNSMGRNYATDLALVGDVKEALKDLDASLNAMLTRQRLNSFGKARGDEVKAISSKMWQSATRR